MKKASIHYSISIVSDEQKDILIALLAEWGVEGFEEKEEILIANGKLDLEAQDFIENYLGENSIKYSKSIIEDKNWNAVWESNFEPVQVEDFVGIRAHFHKAIENVAHEIVITPKMSFGTGHHSTTYLVMKMMQHLPFSQANVFDFGTGTGILAILAEKLGASQVLALDYDDWCIENATENMERNNCSNIKLQKADTAAGSENFDIILANINKNVILANLFSLNKGLKRAGHLILSGLLAEDEAEIVDNSELNGFTVLEKLEKSGWIAIHLQKQ